MSHQCTKVSGVRISRREHKADLYADNWAMYISNLPSFQAYQEVHFEISEISGFCISSSKSDIYLVWLDPDTITTLKLKINVPGNMWELTCH